jgi:hypothetical protein
MNELCNQVCLSIPLSYESDSVDPLLANSVQIVSLSPVKNLGDGFEKIVGVVALELIDPLFHKRK